jgi:hypothetical protein
MDPDGCRAEIVYEWTGSTASGTQVRAGSTDDVLDSKDGGWKVEGTGSDWRGVVRMSGLRVKDTCSCRGCEFPTARHHHSSRRIPALSDGMLRLL